MVLKSVNRDFSRFGIFTFFEEDKNNTDEKEERCIQYSFFKSSEESGLEIRIFEFFAGLTPKLFMGLDYLGGGVFSSGWMLFGEVDPALSPCAAKMPSYSPLSPSFLPGTRLTLVTGGISINLFIDKFLHERAMNSSTVSASSIEYISCVLSRPKCVLDSKLILFSSFPKVFFFTFRLGDF